MSISHIFLFAQEKRTVIIGKIIDTQQNPITSTNISTKDKQNNTISDKYGFYSLKNVNYNDTLIISHVSYQKKEIILNQAANYKDTIRLGIILDENIELLPSVNVLSEKEAIEIASRHIIDYIFYQNDIIFLNTNIKGTYIEFKSIRTEIPEIKYPQKIQFDAFKNIHIHTKDSVFQIYINDSFHAKIIDVISVIKYNKHLMPLKAITENSIILEDLSITNKKKLHRQVKVFYVMNILTKKERKLITLFDKINYEYSKSYYHSILKRYDEVTPERENIIALGIWDGDVNSLSTYDVELIQDIEWYDKIASKPIVAEVIQFNNKYSIFDFSNNKIYNYNSDNEIINTPDFHTKNKKIKKKLLYDQTLKKTYFITEKQGFTSLIPVDNATGNCFEEILIPHRLAENIKVNNGFVYYILPSKEYGQHDKLYKFPL